MIAIVDYGAGNVRSVQKALAHVGADARVTADAADIQAATRVVFPGQGHFGQAMAQLCATGLDVVLQDVIRQQRPFLGICLGLQLLFEASDEAPGVAGLGVLPGTCVPFVAPQKVPQIGWNQLRATQPSPLLDPLIAAGHDYVYFVHSYHVRATEPTDVVAVADYGAPFTAAVQRGALFAAQFHPEKSGQAGLALLRAWLAEDPPC